MDFALTEEQQMFQQLFRDFATKEVAKVADQTDKQEEVPPRLIKRSRPGIPGRAGAPRSLWGRRARFHNLHAPHRGDGRRVCEHGPALCTCTTGSACAPSCSTARRPSRRACCPRWLPASASARCHDRGQRGQRSPQMRTTARRENGAYILNGSKTWVSNGGIAGVFVVFATTDPAGHAHQRVRGARRGGGFGRRPAREDAGHARREHPRLYLRVCVPADHLLGSEGAGYRIARSKRSTTDVSASPRPLWASPARSSIWPPATRPSARAVRHGHREQTGHPDVPG